MIVVGIIVLVIGAILLAIQSLFPVGGQRAAQIIGVILLVVGAILIILGALGYAFLTGGLLLPI